MTTATDTCPHGCDEGVIWDETACGDPDHCAPTYPCPIHHKEDDDE